MAMKDFIYRLALLGLIIVSLACFSSVASAGAVSSAPGSPTLENAVFENGPWGSTFTFTVIYTEANGYLPAPGYPKLYLDNTAMVMVENNPADNDVTDGKVYIENSWTPEKESIGPHNFYFYVETPSGENARTPADDAYEVLWVKHPMSLSCEVDNPEPAVGGTITFSGYLITADDNLGLAGENIILYKIFSENETSIGSVTTDENGHFMLSLEASGPDISCYMALFPGDNYYDISGSFILYSNTLNKLLIFGGYVAILTAIVGVAMFLLSRGITRAHYLTPVMTGFALGFFLLLIGAAELGILAGGFITGYLFAKTAPQWTKHLRIGCIAGLLLLLAVGIISAYSIVTWSPEAGAIYSITQMEIFTSLFTSTIFFLAYYSIVVGIGAMIGGMLRKILKPGEQKPPSGSGETTSSGVEQPQETALPSRQHGDQRNWPKCPPGS
jgi:hypothetical protein